MQQEMPKNNSSRALKKRNVEAGKNILQFFKNSLPNCFSPPRRRRRRQPRKSLTIKISTLAAFFFFLHL